MASQIITIKSAYKGTQRRFLRVKFMEYTLLSVDGNIGGFHNQTES